MGTMKPSPDTFRVTVRVTGRGEFTREVSNVDSPMGTVQAMVAEELGIKMYDVHPVTYEVIRERCPKCGGKLEPAAVRCPHGNCEWGWPRPDAEGREEFERASEED